MDGAASGQRAPENRSAIWRRGGALEIVALLLRETIGGGERVGVACSPPDNGLICLAQSDRRLCQRIEYRLQIESGAADHLEHVGGGGLLLQRLAQFVEQSSVLDGDDGLAGGVRPQGNLLVVEGANFLAVDADHTDQLVVFEHGDGEKQSRRR